MFRLAVGITCILEHSSYLDPCAALQDTRKIVNNSTTRPERNSASRSLLLVEIRSLGKYIERQRPPLAGGRLCVLVIDPHSSGRKMDLTRRISRSEACDIALVDVELCWALHEVVCAGGEHPTGVVLEGMLTSIWRRHLLLARSRAADDDKQGMRGGMAARKAASFGLKFVVGFERNCLFSSVESISSLESFLARKFFPA